MWRGWSVRKDITVLDTIESRGRNGWFNARKVEVFNFENGTAQVDIFSKQIGETAPIVLRGRRNELIALVREILAELGYDIQNDSRLPRVFSSTYCEDCQHPRGTISQSERPLENRFPNNGAEIRCGVCGSDKVRRVK
jgi:hypothetical protein